MRSKIQECGNYQSCRIFIENNLAVKITLSSGETQAVIFKSKFGVNQHDKVFRKQHSFGLKLTENIFKRRHKKRIFVFTLQNWFYF